MEQLDPRKIRGVQERTLRMLSGTTEFSTHEVIFALGELAARLIAKNTGGTWIEKREYLETVTHHMEVTCSAGTAQDSRIILPN